ncbi:hypothetical protein [Streptomyces sp. HC307]|uniref:hypothetical protein n=1 Tax=Streptomyces flavusporus TaxID=3385496 RepID=UPI0039175308
MSVDISRLDVPAAAVEDEAARLWAERDRRIAKARFAARMDRLADLLAHPEYAASGKPAPAGERAELRHLLITADADDTTRPFVDLRKGRTL